MCLIVDFLLTPFCSGSRDHQLRKPQDDTIEYWLRLTQWFECGLSLNFFVPKAIIIIIIIIIISLVYTYQ